MISRRQLLKSSSGLVIGMACAPILNAIPASGIARRQKAMRCINVVNFIRAVEPRFEMDLVEPVREQMAIVKRHNLPATWLLQYDALVSGPFVALLKEQMPSTHEVGFWFEMNEMHCKAAGVEWRGRPGYEWDHIPCVAFTIGYTPEERVLLADTAMKEFHKVWGRYPSSVASWNLDSITIAHLVEKYHVDAFAVCRDQVATDGFTIWGAPIAGYYPSKTNCWSPAVSKTNQIDAPVFRMLGQDPVYYYDLEIPIGGRVVREPDTMEPVWTSGRSTVFIERFLEMIAASPTMDFAYAQLGQENTFPWPDQREAYEPQMRALADLRDKGNVHVETMGDSGRRFKAAFKTTPTQAQVMLADPFDNTERPARTIWYQSRFYRANLHLRGDEVFLRDITVYSDASAQPFLKEATRLHDVEQRMPAVLDGFHWKGSGHFEVDGKRLQAAGTPKVREQGASLIAEIPLTDGRTLTAHFEERQVSFKLTPGHETLTVSFEWDSAKSALVGVTPNKASLRHDEFDYSVGVAHAEATHTASGWKAVSTSNDIVLKLAQTS